MKLFKVNDLKSEHELFSVKNTLPDNFKKRYDKSWGKVFDYVGVKYRIRYKFRNIMISQQ